MCLEEMRALARGLSIQAACFVRGGERSEVKEEVERIRSSVLSFHLSGESAKPVFYLLGCQNFPNRGECPNMADRVANPAVAIAPKHIGRR